MIEALAAAGAMFLLLSLILAGLALAEHVRRRKS